MSAFEKYFLFLLFSIHSALAIPAENLAKLKAKEEKLNMKEKQDKNGEMMDNFIVNEDQMNVQNIQERVVNGRDALRGGKHRL